MWYIISGSRAVASPLDPADRTKHPAPGPRPQTRERHHYVVFRAPDSDLEGIWHCAWSRLEEVLDLRAGSLSEAGVYLKRCASLQQAQAAWTSRHPRREAPIFRQ